MKCNRCGVIIPENDEREHNGETICEDCYMTVLSPAKACDPWAAYCAKSFSEKSGSRENLTDLQARILQILEETGGVDQQELARRLDLSVEDFERELAALRHMEKLRAEMRKGHKIVCLW